MKNKIILILIVVFLILVLIFSNFSNYIKSERKQGVTHECDMSIQDLINKSSSRDTIYLQDKIYYENIIINKELTIIGRNTIIDGRGKDSVVSIKEDNVKILNVKITNSGGCKGDSGIKINSDKNQIKNCVIHRTRTGIDIQKSKNNLITNCFFHTNGEGVFLNSSEKNRIEKCQLRNNGFGIHLKKSKNEIINSSYIHTNGLGIYDKESINSKICNCAICDNNQDGGGIWSFKSKELSIKNSNINHNGAGVKLKESNAEILNCEFFFNMYNALRMKNVEKTIISNCEIKNSYRTAIYVRNSKCNINNNNIYNNYLYGIDIDKNSICDAENNYWGSKNGPSLSSFGKGDRISFGILKNKVFPWETKKLEEVGSKWIVDKSFEKKEINIDTSCNIFFSEKDKDKDNAPDYWEEKWGYNPDKWDDHNNLDPDNDGLNNIEECYTDSYGSNPFYKDIFIEVDYSKGNKPSKKYIEKAEEKFRKHDIELHIDTGELNGGDELPINHISSCSDFSDIYWDFFLHNKIDNPRKGIFHYAVVVDTINELYGGFVFIGLDSLDTIGFATKGNQENYWYLDKDKVIVGGIIHELGHTMGLLIDDYTGIDNDETAKFFTREGWRHKNYFSCLNYRYVFVLLGYSDGTHGKKDFDDWENLDFRFFKDTSFELNERYCN